MKDNREMMGVYENPIDEPMKVTLYKWEYAKLIRQSERLRIIEGMVKELPSYHWGDVMKIVFEKEEE